MKSEEEFFLALSDASGILPAGSLINHQGPPGQKGITWHQGAADAKGFNFSNDKSLHSECRVVGSRLSVQARSGDGSIINTV